MEITKLTTVKILIELYKRFKTIAINKDFTLQKLVNRSVDLYVCDEEYRTMITEYTNCQTSGSNF